MVERVYEIGSELQLEALRKLKILVQTDVYVSVVCRPQITQLAWAIPERPNSWCREIVIVGEPLVAADSRRADRRFPGNFWD